MRLSVRLTADSVEKAIREVKQYKKRLLANADELSRKLAEDGAKLASAKVREVATYGNLNDIAASIHPQKKSSGHWIVIADNFKAPYVELGTGVQGSNSQHPKSAEMGWAYMTGDFTWYNGKFGWWYPTTPDDPNTTLTQTENGDWVAFTSGMPARPFMHETAMQLKETVYSTALEVFKNDKG